MGRAGIELVILERMGEDASLDLPEACFAYIVGRVAQRVGELAAAERVRPA